LINLAIGHLLEAGGKSIGEDLVAFLTSCDGA
jgi:hypothetical protein